jgi:hypothetical protein
VCPDQPERYLYTYRLRMGDADDKDGAFARLVRRDLGALDLEQHVHGPYLQALMDEGAWNDVEAFLASCMDRSEVGASSSLPPLRWWKGTDSGCGPTPQGIAALVKRWQEFHKAPEAIPCSPSPPPEAVEAVAQEPASASPEIGAACTPLPADEGQWDCDDDASEDDDNVDEEICNVQLAILCTVFPDCEPGR